MSTLAVWSSKKTVTLTGRKRHRHNGAAVAPGFVPPNLASTISFDPLALSAAIARTATLLPAPPEFLAQMASGTLLKAQALLEDGPGFGLSPMFAYLADSERTHFAGQIGAGITDLYMNALGYTWRDNAECLASSLDPHADFIYAGGPAAQDGVVLAEARGSFAKTASDAAMARAASSKYLRQVRPYIGAASLHGEVIHGYALAFGAKPTSSGAFLRLSQTMRTKPKATKPPPPKTQSTAKLPPVPGEALLPVPTPIALSASRSNFILMDSQPVANWIDWVSGRREAPGDPAPVPFLRFRYAGRWFLGSIEALVPFPSLPWQQLLDHPNWRWHWLHRRPRSAGMLSFVMEERSAIAFLDGLSGLIREGPRVESLDERSLELPAHDVVGFSTSADDGARRSLADRDDYEYALFRDGLAVIGEAPRAGPIDLVSWNPKEGFDLT